MQKLYILLFGFMFLLALGACSQNVSTIEQGEFPFRVVYEFNGEMHIIESTIYIEFCGIYSDKVPPATRHWQLHVDHDVLNDMMIFREEMMECLFVNGRIFSFGGLGVYVGSPEHYMGDPNVKNLRQEFRHPSIRLGGWVYAGQVRYALEYTLLSQEQAYELFGVRIIEWEFSEPIRNSFR